MADPQLIALSNRHAIYIFTGRVYRYEDEPVVIALTSSVYTRQDGIWQLACR